MTGLIYKDFLALKGHLTTYLVFFLVYGGLCLSGVFTASVLCGMVVLMSLITPMTTVTSDDVSRWNRFAIATPACRRGVVTGKYLFTLLVTLASTVFVSLLLVCTGLALAVNAVNLPLLLLLGVSRSRAALYFVFILFFGGGMALLLLFQRGLLPPPTPGLAAALPWLVTVLCAAAYAASWCIARKIYCKKEL